MDYKAVLIQVLDKNINQEQLAKDLLLMMLVPALEEMAAKSEGKIDDVVVKYIKEFIEAKA